MFCDKVEIKIKAGNGGNGHLSFLHEKYREFGGPDGGDGGDGGNVIFRVNESWNTLYHYKTNRNLKAEVGEEGLGRCKHGKNGHDLIVDVPVGTTVYNSETGKVLADLDVNGAEAIIAKGGEGGYGNAHFTSSTRQTPRFAELGTKGEELLLRLELKLVADVALVGLPNIGKSTLLSVISAAKPKIANYQFTTLVPNLGVVEGFGQEGFVVADLPGLIEGAAQGKGLGDEFLRHIERTRVVAHLLDANSEDIVVDFEKINAEMVEFNPEILKKPQVLVISRTDMVDEDRLKAIMTQAAQIIADHKEIFKYDKKPFAISGVTQTGLRELLLEISSELARIPKKLQSAAGKVYTMKDVKERVEMRVVKEDDVYIVTAPRLELFVQKTDFGNPYAVARIYNIMTKMGIIKKVEKLGARYGDKIKVLDKSVEFKGQ
jgi:GTPase